MLVIICATGFVPQPSDIMVERVENFVYLGSTQSSDGGSQSDIKRRTYRDGLPAYRRSPIQVLTRQRTAGSRTQKWTTEAELFEGQVPFLSNQQIQSTEYKR